MPPIRNNTLFYGDNLPILRDWFDEESIDLIYLDPPFNSNRTYNVLFKDESGTASDAQIQAFEDTWHWNLAAAEAFNDLRTNAAPLVAAMIDALHSFIGENQMMAYLTMMAARLVELHRVLKPTGSIYLHCDPTASHYLKIILDSIFGPRSFQNEIIWKRSAAHGGPVSYNNIHDVILYYSKSDKPTWNQPRAPFDEDYVRTHYINEDSDGRRYQLVSAHGAGDGPPRKFGDRIIPPPPGRHWMSQEHIDQMAAEGKIVYTKSTMPRYKRYLDETEGSPLGTVWDDIPPINSQAAERLGYPTQKPIALLERIITASSKPNDLVLDPFCGCGTTIAAAQALGRRWAGIDITHLAISLQKYRLQAMFPGVAFDVIGEPTDLPGAQQLSQEDRYQFQWWALSLIKAKPVGGKEGDKQGKKGSDKGVDGIINFIDDPKGKLGRVIVQVKSGGVKSGDIQALIGALTNQQGDIGVFITLEEPTKPMIEAGLAAGFFTSDIWQEKYPRIQILSVADLFNGEQVKMPPQAGTFKQPPVSKSDPGQPSLL